MEKIFNRRMLEINKNKLDFCKKLITNIIKLSEGYLLLIN